MKLKWHRRTVRLHHPFQTAHSPRDVPPAKEVLLVSIEHGGAVGWGEAAPVSYYGQSLASAEEVLLAAADMIGRDPFALDETIDGLLKRFPSQPAAVSGVDIAMHDLVGKLLDKPLWVHFGLKRGPLPLSSFTIGIDRPEIIEKKVVEAEAFPILKVKVGTPGDDQTLSAIRRVAPRKTLRVDANSGWTSANLLDRCRSVLAYDVELIEQPTAPGDDDALPALREAAHVPIIADESCHGVDDVRRCAGLFDGINIKLSKCGGIRQARLMIDAARSCGLKIMLGCMVETSVGIAASAQLASLADYLDLDGHLLMADDPFEGIGGAGGVLTLSDRPGLGVRPRA